MHTHVVTFTDLSIPSNFTAPGTLSKVLQPVSARSTSLVVFGKPF